MLDTSAQLRALVTRATPSKVVAATNDNDDNDFDNRDDDSNNLHEYSATNRRQTDLVDDGLRETNDERDAQFDVQKANDNDNNNNDFDNDDDDEDRKRIARLQSIQRRLGIAVKQ